MTGILLTEAGSGERDYNKNFLLLNLYAFIGCPMEFGMTR